MRHSFRLAALLWISSFQYFVVQLVVAAQWQQPTYSWLQNAISDLGNTACAQYGDRFVCSPLYGVMNASFIILGITQLVGAVLLYRSGQSRVLRIGLVCMMLAGIGTVLVGIFPENTIGSLHLLGAVLPFVIGNFGLLLCARLFPHNKTLRVFSRVCGTVALAACVLLYFKLFLGLGFGGMERIAAYPQTVWLIVTGIWLLRHPTGDVRAR